MNEIIIKLLNEIKANIRALRDDNEYYTAGLDDAIYQIDLKIREENFNV